MQEALDSLHNFLNKNKILDTKFIFITCGDWDLQTCLFDECEYKNIKYPSYLRKYIDIKTLFKERNSLKKERGMKGML